MRISVIIPVWNSSTTLVLCLEALRRSSIQPDELIVVDDGSEDNSAAVARAAGAEVLHTAKRSGPAAARNLGVSAATGDLVIFLDADITVHEDTLERLVGRFTRDATLDAVVGSYDDQPAAPGVVAQYKNLLHHYTHQNARAEAETFWSACGACRREVFLAVGGFDQSYGRPCIEDIEFGYRLRSAGYRIALDRSIQIKHLKHYRLAGMLRSDIFDRALPWTRLILRTRRMPNDLNLSLAQRAAAALVVLGALALPFCPGPFAIAAVAAVAVIGPVALNYRFFGFLARCRGLLFMLQTVPLHLLYYLYSVAAFGAGVVVYAVEEIRGVERAASTS